MEKSKLERFISKYNLGGACESVLFTAQDTTMATRGISDDKNVLCEVTVKNLQFPSGDFGVYDTKKLRSILGVLNETLSVKANVNNEKMTGLDINDGDTRATFVLADPSVIPTVPDLKKTPPMDVTIKLDEKFVATFIKAKGALNDVEMFTVTSNGTDATAEVIIGHSSLNTNRIAITATIEEPKTLDPINFSATHFREILASNKEVKNGTLEVSSKGLARATFEADDIVSTYYLVQIKV